MNKLSLFQSLVYSKSVGCFFITESWLTKSVGDGEILPSGYRIYRCDRSGRGGGVLVAISCDIPSRQLYTCDNCELLVIELDLKPKIAICCIYLPPSCPDAVFNASMVHLYALPRECDIIVVGDFNTPDINWESLTAVSSRSNVLCDFVDDYNLVQQIQSPTHSMGNILDLVLTTSPDRINGITNQPTTSSDHNLISFNILVNIHRPKPSKLCNKVFNYTLGNWEGLVDYLMDANPTTTGDGLDVNLLYDSFSCAIQQACVMYIPQVEIPTVPSPPWYNREIRYHLKKLRTARRNHLHKASPESLSKFTKLEETVGQLITNSKETYIASLADSFSTQPKNLYGYLRKLQIPSEPSMFINTSSELVTTAEDAAIAFNELFHSTFTQSNYVLPAVDLLPSPHT